MSKHSSWDLKLAEMCRTCPVCRHGRAKQEGVSFWIVKNVENKVCPACRAYERVYGKKAHEPTKN